MVSSTDIIDYYSEAFQIDKSKIKPLGLPRADYYFENHDVDKLRDSFFKKYGFDPNKKGLYYMLQHSEMRKNTITFLIILI